MRSPAGDRSTVNPFSSTNDAERRLIHRGAHRDRREVIEAFVHGKG